MSRKQGRIARVTAHIEEMMQEMEENARKVLLKANVTARTRKAIEVAHKRYVLWQGLRVRNRFSREQQRWMRLLLVDRLIENPHLHDKLRQTVQQLRQNYGFEWVSCPFTALAQAEARKIILMAAESEFGDTPMAGPLAFVRFHNQTHKIEDITNYDEAYLRAVRLDADRAFVDKGAALREELGIKAPAAGAAGGPARVAAAEPRPSET
ncbi:MAG: hypothetical protein PVH68_02185 [Armatimonadota bacterium]